MRNANSKIAIFGKKIEGWIMKNKQNTVTGWLVAVLFIALASFSFAGSASMGHAKGTLVGINSDEGSMILSTSKGFVKLAVNQNSMMTRDTATVALNELVIGEQMSVTYDKGSLTVLSASATFGKVSGWITSIHLTPGLNPKWYIVITEYMGRPTTLTLQRNSVLTRDKIQVTAEKLMVGDKAAAIFDARNFQIVRLDATSPAQAPQMMKAKIINIVPVNTGSSPYLEVTVQGEAKPLELYAMPYTTVTIDEKPATIWDMRKGYTVVATYDAVTRIAIDFDCYGYK
jgi:hypothetical protein